MLITNFAFSQLLAMLICLILSVFILTRHRSYRSVNLGLFFLFSFLYHSGYFIAYSFFNKFGSIGWIISAASTAGLLVLNNFAYSHPDLIFKKEKKIATFVYSLLLFFSIAEYFYRVNNSIAYPASFFYSTNNYSTMLSIVGVFINLHIIVVSFRQAFKINSFNSKHKGLYRNIIQTIFSPSNNDASSVRNFGLISILYFVNNFWLSTQLGLSDKSDISISSIYFLVYILYVFNYFKSSVHIVHHRYKVAGLGICSTLLIINLAASILYQNFNETFDKNAVMNLSLINSDNPINQLSVESLNNSGYSFFISDKNGELSLVYPAIHEVISSYSSMVVWDCLPGLRQILIKENSIPIHKTLSGKRYFAQINKENYFIYGRGLKPDRLFTGIKLEKYLESINHVSIKLVVLVIFGITISLIIFPIMYFFTLGNSLKLNKTVYFNENPVEIDEAVIISINEKSNVVKKNFIINPEIEIKLKNSIDYIYSNYQNEITRDSLADNVGLSPAYFGKQFKIYTGKKISDYINELRVQKAVELLTATDKSVIEIAFDSGFESLRTFYRAFYNTLGTTAIKYRENIRNNNISSGK